MVFKVWSINKNWFNGLPDRMCSMIGEVDADSIEEAAMISGKQWENEKYLRVTGGDLAVEFNND